MNIAGGDARLVLLCPAWKRHGTATAVKPDARILHSRADDVIPFADSEELVKNCGLPAKALIEVGTDHRLADPESLAAMLEACEQCRQNESEWSVRYRRPTTEDPMREPEYADPSQLRPGPIRHRSLPPLLLEQIKAVYGEIGPDIDMTREQFETGFKRDVDPESEVALWCRISGAWLGYHNRFVRGESLSGEEEKKLMAALIAISSGVEDMSELPVPAEVGRRLRACYDSLAGD
jgi:hypothetical protein